MQKKKKKLEQVGVGWGQIKYRPQGIGGWRGDLTYIFLLWAPYPGRDAFVSLLSIHDSVIWLFSGKEWVEQ